MLFSFSRYLNVSPDYLVTQKMTALERSGKLVPSWTGKLVPDQFFFFKKSFILDKSKSSATWFHYILIALKLAYNRNKLFKTFQYCTRDMFNFDILDKGLSEFFLQHIFCIVFQQKCSSSHILLTDQMSLPDYVYFLRYLLIIFPLISSFISPITFLLTESEPSNLLDNH